MEDEKVQDEKFQSSAHEVLNQPLQDYRYFLRKNSLLIHIGNPVLRDQKEQKQVRETSPSLTWIKTWRYD